MEKGRGGVGGDMDAEGTEERQEGSWDENPRRPGLVERRDQSGSHEWTRCGWMAERKHERGEVGGSRSPEEVPGRLGSGRGDGGGRENYPQE